MENKKNINQSPNNDQRRFEKEQREFNAENKRKSNYNPDLKKVEQLEVLDI